MSVTPGAPGIGMARVDVDGEPPLQVVQLSYRHRQSPVDGPICGRGRAAKRDSTASGCAAPPSFYPLYNWTKVFASGVVHQIAPPPSEIAVKIRQNEAGHPMYQSNSVVGKSAKARLSGVQNPIPPESRASSCTDVILAFFAVASSGGLDVSLANPDTHARNIQHGISRTMPQMGIVLSSLAVAVSPPPRPALMSTRSPPRRPALTPPARSSCSSRRFCLCSIRRCLRGCS